MPTTKTPISLTVSPPVMEEKMPGDGWPVKNLARAAVKPTEFDGAAKGSPKRGVLANLGKNTDRKHLATGGTHTTAIGIEDVLNDPEDAPNDIRGKPEVTKAAPKALELETTKVMIPVVSHARTSLEQRVKELEEQVTKKDSEIASLQKQNDIQEGSLVALRAEKKLRGKNSVRRDFTAEKERVKNGIRKMYGRIADLEGRTATQAARLFQVSTQRDELARMNRTLTAKLEVLQNIENKVSHTRLRNLLMRNNCQGTPSNQLDMSQSEVSMSSRRGSVAGSSAVRPSGFDRQQACLAFPGVGGGEHQMVDDQLSSGSRQASKSPRKSSVTSTPRSTVHPAAVGMDDIYCSADCSEDSSVRRFVG